MDGLQPLNLDNLRIPLIETDSSSSLISRITSCAKKILNHPWTAYGLSLAGSIAIAVSSSILHPTINNYVDNCIEDLNVFSGKLEECREPYEKNLVICKAIIGISSGILGFVIQKFWEPSEREEISSDFCEKIKKQIEKFQKNCSYEFNLFLGYLYNGLWIDTSSLSSWKFYFGSQTAAIGLAASALGMFTRIQYRAFKLPTSDLEDLEVAEEETSSFYKKNWKILLLNGISTIFFPLTFTNPELFSEKSLRITRELCFMNFGRFIGQLSIRKIEKIKTNPLSPNARNTVSYISTGLKLAPGLLVTIGYSIYIENTRSIASRLSGIGMIGIACGIKDSYYRETEKFNFSKIFHNLSPNISNCNQIAQKIRLLMMNQWKTVALTGFVIALNTSSLLKCYDLKNYNCPIAFELSGNYVNIDGQGLGIIIISGLTQYYGIRIITELAERLNHPAKKILSKCLSVIDKYQFDALALIPFSMINAGNYIKDYDAYATYNSIPLLLLIGYTMGTYNAQIHGKQNYSSKLPFTHNSALTST